MPKMELRLSKRMKQAIEKVAAVDEISQMQVIRDALEEYIDELDMEWYEREYEKLDEED